MCMHKCYSTAEYRSWCSNVWHIVACRAVQLLSFVCVLATIKVWLMQLILVLQPALSNNYTVSLVLGFN